VGSRTATILLCFATFSQVQAQNSAQQAAGVTAEWDVRSQMAAIATDVRRVEPLLKQANPSQWTERGAPQAYISQLQSAQASVQSLITVTQQLADQPENLMTALDAYFQMERMELLLNSIRDGIRKYQSGSLADQFNRVFAGNSVDRDRLRQHIRDLANMRDQEFQIANQEAQRCRGILTRQTPPDRKSGRNQSRPADRN